MYKTETFFDISGIKTVSKYEKWLKEFQKWGRLEIISVISHGNEIVVTYKESI